MTFEQLNKMTDSELSNYYFNEYNAHTRAINFPTTENYGERDAAHRDCLKALVVMYKRGIVDRTDFLSEEALLDTVFLSD